MAIYRQSGTWLEIPWHLSFYQYANRIAHLYYLKVLNDIKAQLLFVSFINDSEMRGPSSSEAWEACYQILEAALGLKPKHALSENIHHVIIDTKKLVWVLACLWLTYAQVDSWPGLPCNWIRPRPGPSCDLGFRSHNYEDDCKVLIMNRYRKLILESLKRWWKHLFVVVPVIWHMKHEHGLSATDSKARLGTSWPSRAVRAGTTSRCCFGPSPVFFPIFILASWPMESTDSFVRLGKSGSSGSTKIVFRLPEPLREEEGLHL